MTAPVAKLGHVAAETPDLPASVGFFRDVIGLREVERTADTVYLRGLEDFEHHTLSLTASDAPGIAHIGWRTTSPEALEKLGGRFESDGHEVESVPARTGPRQGEAIRVTTPTGHPYEFYYDVERTDAPESERSKLKNRVYSPSVANRIAPRRIDHVHVQDPEADRYASWMDDELGFEVRERLHRERGDVWGWWMSVTALPHDIGIHRIDTASAARFHHLSYHVDSRNDLWDAADILREHDIAPDAGPGMHAITKADFLYVRDPASGLRLELFAGPGYLVFEPDWEPIEWYEDDIGTDDDHQWIGSQYSEEGTPYKKRDET